MPDTLHLCTTLTLPSTRMDVQVSMLPGNARHMNAQYHELCPVFELRDMSHADGLFMWGMFYNPMGADV